MSKTKEIRCDDCGFICERNGQRHPYILCNDCKAQYTQDLQREFGVIGEVTQ